MATYPPPNFIEPLDEFNTSNWITNATAVGFTPDQIAYLNAKYLKFPVAQGLETLQALIVNGVATFNNTALPTSLGTLPAPNTISTQIPTMDWVQQAITAGGSTILANNNTFLGTNAFQSTLTSTGSMPSPTTSNQEVATTQFVQLAIQASANTNNTYGGLQEALIYSELPYNYTQIGSITPTTLYTYGVATSAFGASKSNNVCAYSISNGIFVDIDPTSSINSSSSGITLSFSPQIPFEPCIISFSADGKYGLITSNQQGVDTSEVYLYSVVNGNPTLTDTGLYDYFSDAVMSATGEYSLVAGVASGSGELKISSNYASTFSNVSGVGTYMAVAISATGKYMMALDQYSGVRVSIDNGTTWSYNLSSNDPFYRCAMSANGQYQIAVCNDLGGGGGSAFISSDYGAVWTNIDGLVGGTQLWRNISISDDGRVIIGYCDNNVIKLSTTYGNSWTTPSFTTLLNGYTRNTFSVNNKYLMGMKSGSIPVYVPFASFW